MAAMRQSLWAFAITAASLPCHVYAQTTPASDPIAESDWSAVLYILLVILIFAIALFVWFHRRQRGRQSRDE
jgi:ABC-type phosphate transport system permease subunit